MLFFSAGYEIYRITILSGMVAGTNASSGAVAELAVCSFLLLLTAVCIFRFIRYAVIGTFTSLLNNTTRGVLKTTNSGAPEKSDSSFLKTTNSGSANTQNDPGRGNRQ